MGTSYVDLRVTVEAATAADMGGEDRYRKETKIRTGEQ
jgi:hypothetical protein